ncbi:MAG: nucleoside triphosphate pyrophosphohydrolase [Myxococcota bacterium]
MSGETLPELVAIMRTLLGPKGCPWDKEQTLESLRPYVVEEAHEVVDAIDKGDAEGLREELGDLLFQIVFQSELAAAQEWFGIDDVVAAIRDKMVRRHPWVFGDQTIDTAEGALDRWEAMKAKEKKDRGALGGVPVALPALLRALRVGEKAAAVGYDWPEAAGARAKVDEELAEFDEAVRADDREAMEAELGDLLFALSSLARKHSLDPEAALRGSLGRFSRRFRHAELAAQERGGLRELDDEARDALWDDAKAAESS